MNDKKTRRKSKRRPLPPPIDPMVKFTGTCPASVWSLIATQAVAHGATIERVATEATA